MAPSDTPPHQRCVLAQRGYNCGVTFRRSYRGSHFLSQIVTADLGNKLGYVSMPPDHRIAHQLKIRSIQHELPIAAQILDVIENKVFVIEQAAGVLLWEIEDGLPSLAFVEEKLNSFVSSMQRVGLVHGDIRPWNIFYDKANDSVKVIDWGFSFFIGDQLEPKTLGHLQARGHDVSNLARVDRVDVERTLRVLDGKLSYEAAWRHGPNEIEWRPKWAKREIG
jgi:hypothetical protein